MNRKINTLKRPSNTTDMPGTKKKIIILENRKTDNYSLSF